MIGAMMLMTKTWDKDGVYNIEEFDPDRLWMPSMSLDFHGKW